MLNKTAFEASEAPQAAGQAGSADLAAPALPVDTSRAIAALAWARLVATEAPEALATPPELPTLEEARAVPVSVLREYLDALLLGRNTQEGLDALLLANVLEAWLPEVHAMVGFGDGEWRHKDVWKHTKQVVWQSVPRLPVRWGALLHDIGKIKTRKIEASGEVHFFGHSEVGAAMFRKRVGKRLGFEGDLYDRVHYLILYHLRASQYDGGWTDSAVRRFGKEMGDGLTDLLDLSRADITTKRPEKKKKGLRQISELSDRIEQVEKDDAKLPPLSKGIGTAIMAHFGLSPSRKVGDLKKRLEDEIAAGTIEARREDAYYLAWLEGKRSEWE